MMTWCAPVTRRLASLRRRHRQLVGGTLWQRRARQRTQLQIEQQGAATNAILPPRDARRCLQGCKISHRSLKELEERRNEGATTCMGDGSKLNLSCARLQADDGEMWKQQSEEFEELPKKRDLMGTQHKIGTEQITHWDQSVNCVTRHALRKLPSDSRWVETASHHQSINQ